LLIHHLVYTFASSAAAAAIKLIINNSTFCGDLMKYIIVPKSHAADDSLKYFAEDGHTYNRRNSINRNGGHIMNEKNMKKDLLNHSFEISFPTRIYSSPDNIIFLKNTVPYENFPRLYMRPHHTIHIVRIEFITG